MNIFLFYLWTAPSKALKVGKIQYCYSTGNSSWNLNNSSWKFNNSPSNIRCAKNYSFLFSGDKTFADWQGRNYLIDGCKRWVGIRMRGKKVIWPVIYLRFSDFLEMKSNNCIGFLKRSVPRDVSRRRNSMQSSPLSFLGARTRIRVRAKWCFCLDKLN